MVKLGHPWGSSILDNVAFYFTWILSYNYYIITIESSDLSPKELLLREDGDLAGGGGTKEDAFISNF